MFPMAERNKYMLQNYQYFITISETLNISKAAEKLFISHQCLSRYLKTLEEECGMTLFNRKPKLSLTYAGRIFLNSLREIQQIEQNTHKALEELKTGEVGVVRLGVTEGRLRIILPDLLKKFGRLFPKVTLQATAAPTTEMLTLLSENKLDLVLGTTIGVPICGLNYSLIMNENLYLVISDNLLKKYFPDSYPECKQIFANGADLGLFKDVPFPISVNYYHSSKVINKFLQDNNLSLDFIYTATQPDLLHLLAANDYAASFCLSMYLDNIRKINTMNPAENKLHTFPIKGLVTENPVYLITPKGVYFPTYTKELIKLIQRQCKGYLKAEPNAKAPSQDPSRKGNQKH